MVEARSKSPAINHAAAILRLLASAPQAAGLTTIARAVNVSPSSCFNILRTLADESFVSFDSVSKTYSLGSAIIRLARAALDPENAMRVARDVLRGLVGDHDVTACLWRVTHDGRITIVGVEMNDSDTRLYMTAGVRVPLLSGAAGRSVTALSNIPRPRLETMFEKLRWEQAPTFDEYLRELNSARMKGWALDHGEFKRGVTSVAAAICDHEDVPHLSVSASMLGGDYDAALLEKIGAATATAAHRIRQLIYGISPNEDPGKG
ncbi:IclR family transcriptional regulator [Sphingomonas oligophenolica]|uniref:IclR family transcriptional regulator n=1 Tax=Sphingomonas oligophenolica TaxID=301154 RepID=A0ABU9Y690_9SPHN